jgi:hypothetical protein
MRRGARTAVVAATALALGGSLPVGARPGAGPLEDAGEAAERLPFAAVVSVEWTDRHGTHRTRVDMAAAGGSVHITGPQAVLAAARRSPSSAGGWVLAWPGAGSEVTPAVERKYEIVRAPGPVVAGRPTHLLLLHAGGELRERMAVDETTRLILRREVFGPVGRPSRVVTVEHLEMRPLPRPGARERAGPAPPRPLRPTAVPPPYRAPAELAGGYHRVGAYQRSGVVQHLYSDGLHGLSLFVRPGALSDRLLPSGGEQVGVRRATGLRYVWAGGEIVTWKAGPMVHTLVGEAPFDEVLAAARSVPAPDRLSLGARLRSSCRRVTEVISGGR